MVWVLWLSINLGTYEYFLDIVLFRLLWLSSTFGFLEDVYTAIVVVCVSELNFAQGLEHVLAEGLEFACCLSSANANCVSGFLVLCQGQRQDI